MLRNLFGDLLIDPRKLLVGGFLLCVVTMAAHVMDCEFPVTDYLFMVICIAFLLPLFTLGKVEPFVEITIPNKVAGAFLAVSLAVVGYNIAKIGAPLLLLKILRGESLEKQYGFYYHHRFKLSFLVWSLFTVMIPMAFFVESKVLKYSMLVWSITASTLIQIKMPFLFGFFYVAILYKITRRKIAVLPLATVGGLLLILFYFVNSTRTGESLANAGYLVGLSEEWSELDPALWGPASYLAAPIANALLTCQYDAFRFDLDGIMKILPAMLTDPMGMTYEYTEKFPKLAYVRWYDASNIISGWGHLANNVGIVGMLAFNSLVGFLSVLAAKRGFGRSPWVLALFIVCCRNAALYPVEDYFFESSGLAEVLLLGLAFGLSKIDYEKVEDASVVEESVDAEPEPVGAVVARQNLVPQQKLPFVAAPPSSGK